MSVNTKSGKLEEALRIGDAKILDKLELEKLLDKIRVGESLKPSERADMAFAERENQDLGVVKYLRKPVSRLDLSPFPAPS